MAKTTVNITGTVPAAGRLVTAAQTIPDAAYDASAIASILTPATADGQVDIYVQYPVNGVYEDTPPTARLTRIDSISNTKASTEQTGRPGPVDYTQPGCKFIVISTSTVATTLSLDLTTVA